VGFGEANGRLAAAQGYRGKDYSVIPCHSNKKPCIDSWAPHQSEAARKYQLEEWWSNYPDANPAIVTGEVSGVMVVDVDSEEGRKALEEFLPENYATPIARTPSGGLHYYFKYRPGLRNRVRAISGCDIRTDGGYVLAPPGNNGNGRSYEWLPDLDLFNVEPAEMPEILFDVLRQGVKCSPTETSAEQQTLILEGVCEGQRNSTAAKLAGRYFNMGLATEEVTALLETWNDHNIPPLSDKELHTTIESIKRTDERNNPKRQATQEITGYSASDLICKEFTDPRWIIPGIIPEGYGVLSGKPKHGKSILGLNMGISVALGCTALGSIKVDEAGVLYLALEDTARRLQQRLQQIIPDRSPVPENLYLYPQWPRMGNRGLTILREWLQEHSDTGFVIIDTLAKFRPPKPRNTSPYDFDYEVGSKIKSVADEYGITIIAIHHLRKTESEDRMDDVSGTFGITGSADTTMVLARKSGQADAILHVTGRDVESAEYALQFDSPTLSWQLLGRAEEVKSTEKMQAVFNAIRDHGQPMSPKEIFTATGYRIDYIYKTVPKLVEDGSVKKVGRGMYVCKERGLDG